MQMENSKLILETKKRKKKKKRQKFQWVKNNKITITNIKIQCSMTPL